MSAALDRLARWGHRADRALQALPVEDLPGRSLRLSLGALINLGGLAALAGPGWGIG